MKKKSNEQQLLTLTVDRKLTGEYVDECEAAFSDALQKFTGTACVLDMTHSPMIDSSGIGLCVGVYKECKKRSIAFHIEATHDLIKFFKMLKLDKVLELREMGDQ